MDTERWLRIKEIYRAALDRPHPERAEFVREACAGDDALAAEILALLETSGGATEALGGIVSDVAGSASSGWWGGSVAGERIGPYRLLDVIGEGGMGQVYLAERADHEFEQRVAIKMANWLRASPQVIERFRIERQILANLEHPNIARLLDGGRTEAGVPYIVMDYVDGASIVDYAASRSLDERLELFLARSVDVAREFGGVRRQPHHHLGTVGAEVVQHHRPRSRPGPRGERVRRLLEERRRPAVGV